jgi:hypothetical protein
MNSMEHDEDPIGARLRSELRAQAERDPLPLDFALTLAENLPEQSRPRSVWVLAALAVTALVALATLAVGASLLDWRIGSSSAAPNASTYSGNPGPSAALTLTQFANEYGPEFAFDYPSDWRIIEQGINARHYQWIPVVIGTGDWTLNCQPTPPTSLTGGGITCGADIFTVPPGGVVVEFFSWQGPLGAPETPPPEATELPSGLLSTVAEGPTDTLWRIYIPGWLEPLVVAAQYREPDVELRREQVRVMVESLVVFPEPSP